MVISRRSTILRPLLPGLELIKNLSIQEIWSSLYMQPWIAAAAIVQGALSYPWQRADSRLGLREPAPTLVH